MDNLAALAVLPRYCAKSPCWDPPTGMLCEPLWGGGGRLHTLVREQVTLAQSAGSVWVLVLCTSFVVVQPSVACWLWQCRTTCWQERCLHLVEGRGGAERETERDRERESLGSVQGRPQCMTVLRPIGRDSLTYHALTQRTFFKVGLPSSSGKGALHSTNCLMSSNLTCPRMV